jgi:hypothetical protein
MTRSDLIVVDDIRMLPAGQEAAEAFNRITDAPTPQSAVTSKSNDHAQDPRHRHRGPAGQPRPTSSRPTANRFELNH